jgi:hypothetical protein
MSLPDQERRLICERRRRAVGCDVDVDEWWPGCKVHRRGNLMTRTLEELEAIVRERICGVCTDRTVAGDCGLEEPSSCALFRLFPQVARAVQSVSSDDIRDYIHAIRQQVCSVCSEQTSDGECESRKQVQCALDAYLLPIGRCHRGIDREELRSHPSGDFTHSSASRVGDITPRACTKCTNLLGNTAILVG